MKLRGAILVAACALLLAACADSSLNEGETTFHLRSLNLVEDLPTLAIDLDDTNVANLAYGSATTFSPGHPGKHDVAFNAVLPGDLDAGDDDDETSTPVSSTSYTFLAGTDYTLVAYGELTDIHSFLVEGFEQRDDVDDEKLVLQFTHAAPDAPQVDVYITAVQAGMTTRQYVDTLALTETSAPLEVTLNRDDDLDDDATLSVDVIVELLVTGTGETLYRSNTMTLAEQNRVLFAIANNNGSGPAAVKLVLAGANRGRGASIRPMPGRAVRR